MNRKDTFLLGTSLIVSLAILEIGLRIFTPYPVSWVSNKIRHETLGYVMNPELAGIDKSGFRNEGQEIADIAAIGDSYTYGINVSSEYSWPKLLGQKLNKNVYNYGVGGYGLLQYSSLIHGIVEKKPEAIVVGLYLANDLEDVCRHAIANKYTSERAKQVGMDIRLCPTKTEFSQGTSQRFPINKFLTSKVAFYSLLADHFSRYAMERRLNKKIDKSDNSGDLIINDDMQKTIIHAESIKRNAAFMDLDRPDITMAFGLLKEFLQNARRAAQDKNIEFGVVLIPSKTRVFYSYLREQGYRLTEEYERSVLNEDRLRSNTIAYMAKISVPSSDALPGMEAALRKFKNMYPATIDGHPLDKGYLIIADAAARLFVKKMQHVQ